MAELKDNEMVTGVVRLNFAHIWEPKSDPKKPNDKPKFKLMAVIDKEDKETLRQFKAIVDVLKDKSAAANGGFLADGFKSPLRDGDKKAQLYPELAGKFYFNASTTYKPAVINAKGFPETIQSEVYSGCYVRLYVNLFLYGVNGEKGLNGGISVGILGVQKVKDGESLGGTAVSAAAAFGFNPDSDKPMDNEEDFLN